MSINRRTFLGHAVIAAGGIATGSCGRSRNTSRKKVIVLGIDGMDPVLTESFMRRGIMPNVARITAAGGFSPMITTMPPQSPVAWSTVITGAHPGVHGVYDFVHRDLADMQPYFSLSRVTPPERTIGLGGWNIPLEKGETVQLRQGTPFWDVLDAYDIPGTLFKIPANFPVMPSRIDMVSGMGTPDLRGGYGNFTVFTTSPEQFPADLSGGRVILVDNMRGTIRTALPGPANTLREDSPETEIPLTITCDATNPVIRLRIQNHDLVLGRGDWSGWLRLSFPVANPLMNISAVCKVYVKSVHPELILYVSPLNIDPADPALPIFSSDRYGEELTKQAGTFYTQGFPEDTKALSNGVLDEDEYLALAAQVFTERNRLLDIELNRFDSRGEGLLFFYYSSVDQNSHMYWRLTDPAHPLYNRDLAGNYGDTLEHYYSGIDEAVGRVLKRYDPADPDFTVLIISDHGFTSFRRQVNLNTWLAGQELVTLTGEKYDSGYFTHVDWLNTKAYAVGINSIYLNIKGREPYGGLHASLAEKTRESLKVALLAMTDPATGERAVADVRIVPDEERRIHPNAPDLIVGWNAGYRTSWDSVLGGVSPEVFSDNLDKWSGDHCMAPRCVPATLVANRPVLTAQPALTDIGATILAVFGLDAPEGSEGTPLLTQS